MAYKYKGLSVLSYANGFTLWHYRTDDSLTEVIADGYFDPGYDMIRKGDFIIVNASNGNTFMFAPAKGEVRDNGGWGK